jgi:hypothetical protein
MKSAFRSSVSMRPAPAVVVSLMLALGCGLFPLTAWTQWQSPLQVTSDSTSESPYTIQNGILANGQTVRFVYSNISNGHSNIYYTQSNDRGVTWETAVSLTNDTMDAYWPCIVADGNDVHVAYYTPKFHPNGEIMYQRSTDGGSRWMPSRRMTTDTAMSKLANLAVQGKRVHLIWGDARNTHEQPYYRASSDGGENWSPEIPLSSGLWESSGPSIACTDSSVIALWNEVRNGCVYILYRRAGLDGQNWENEQVMTTVLYNPNLYRNHPPAFATSGKTVHMIWMDLKDGNEEIYHKRSADEGRTWCDSTRLSKDPAYSSCPAISACGDLIHVAWQDYRQVGPEPGWGIYYKRSTDAGRHWTDPERRIFSSEYYTNQITITAAVSSVHLLFTSHQEVPFYGIYYLRNPTANNPDPLGSEACLPASPDVLTQYPNPFSVSTTITYTLAGNGWARLTLMDMLGRPIAILRDGFHTAGSHQTSYDARNLSSGMYRLRLDAHGVVIDRIMTLVR